MSDFQPVCADLEAAGFNQENAARDVWRMLLQAGTILERPDDNPFIFAHGDPATVKVDAEILDHRPEARGRIMGYVGMFPCIAEADALLYVPDGMRKFTVDIGQKLGIPVAHMERDPSEGASRFDFVFSSPEDRDLALGASRPRILEDVVTTLGSVAGVVRHLDPDQQDIHSLVFLLRGQVDPKYRRGLSADHYLAERYIPRSRREFMMGLSGMEREIYKKAKRQRETDGLPE